MMRWCWICLRMLDSLHTQHELQLLVQWTNLCHMDMLVSSTGPSTPLSTHVKHSTLAGDPSAPTAMLSTPNKNVNISVFSSHNRR